MKTCYCCEEEAVTHCDHCDNPFCEDHGDPGCDCETDSGLRAYPSTCDACHEDLIRRLAAVQYL